MLPLEGNFSNHNRFRKTGWHCRCGSREKQEHILSHCVIYEDIRKKYGDMDDDVKLVGFFEEVLQRTEEKRSRIGRSSRSRIEA